MRPDDPAATEINLVGQVTVPDPFPTAQNAFTVEVGGKNATLHPDASGLSVSPEAILLVKNIVPSGNGVLRGGTLEFELTLKGSAWLDELRRVGALRETTPVTHAEFPVKLQVGTAQHSAPVTLEVAK